jgi:peptide/nickel transport system substrate-binding protein
MKLPADPRTALRRPLRRPLLTGAAIVLLAGVAACSGGSGGAAGLTSLEASAAKSDVAIVQTQTGSTANGIYPIDTGSQETPFTEQMFQDLMWRPLLWYGGQTGNEFGLYNALSVGDAPVWSDNDTVVTVTLKPYKWSDGQAVTARDVVFYMNMIKADKNNWGGYTPGEFPDNVKSYAALSNSTVQFTLTRSFSPLWYDTNQLSDVIPLPQQEWDRESAGGPVGSYDLTPSGATKVNNFLVAQDQQESSYASNPIWQVVDGPWKLAKFSASGDIDLVPNAAYTGPDKPHLKELIYRPYTSSTAEFDALLTGAGLTSGYIPNADVSQTSELESEGYQVYNTPYYGINFVVINFNSPTVGYLFRQLYIRQALQELVNQPQDVKYAYSGQATPSYGPVALVPASPYLTSYEKNNPYPYSVANATSLLSSHGWKINKGGTDVCTQPGTGPGECGAGIPAGKQLIFKFVYASDDPEYTVMMDNYQSDASYAGVKLQLSQGAFNNITGITGVCAMGTSACNWEGVMYGGQIDAVYPTGNGYYNTDAPGQGNYNSAQADTLINQTMYSPSTAAFDEYENYIAEQLPMIWMPWQQTDYNAVVLKNLHGFTGDMDNPFSDTFPELWNYAK